MNNLHVIEETEKCCIMMGLYDSRKGIYPMNKAEHILMFSIKLLNKEPDAIINNSKLFKYSYILASEYIGLVRDQNDEGLPIGYDEHMSLQNQYDELDSYYYNQLIFFKPIYKYDDNLKEYHKNLQIIDVRNIPTVMDDKSFFKVVPYINIDHKTFEQLLLSNKYINFELFPGDVYGSLDYVICNDYLYFSDNWTFDSNNPKLWTINKDEVVRYKINLKSNRILFAPTDYHEIVFLERTYPSLLEVQATKQVIKNDVITPAIQENINSEVLTDNNTPEINMLYSFKQKVAQNNLCYDKEDLINLHICAKSSQLTILAGMSGTGKTQLALQYANILGASETSNTLLFIAIRPSYCEPEDLIGYLNPNTGQFIPSETGLIDLLIHGQNNPQQMHVVLFDEMNLSQIEHWFSPFISILEKEENSRMLSLYNEHINCYNEEQYPSKIKIGSNILFIGTINLDESSKELSDRLLDRAFIINLRKKSFLDYRQEQLQNSPISVNKQVICNSTKLFQSWRSKKKPIMAYHQDELKFLDALHEVISKYDEQKGISFRVLKNIGNYLNNIPSNIKGEALLSRGHAIDLVLKQTVMKKISGPENKIGNLVGHINKIGDIPSDSMLISLFEEYEHISQFTLCKETIKRKAEDLFTYGFTR